MPQGNYLTRGGAREVDYTITVGDGACDVLSLTDNEILCRLPSVEPNKSANDAFCKADARSLQVYTACALDYVHEDVFQNL